MEHRMWQCLLAVLPLLLMACSSTPEKKESPNRAVSLPAGAVKVTSDTDLQPPILHSDQWNDPLALSDVINTAGVEDAPVVTPDGNTLLFVFTPDANSAAEDQLMDGVSGIWKSVKEQGKWSEPERVILHNDVALDGSFAIHNDTLWFGSFRQGNLGSDGDIYTATWKNNAWVDWENAGAELNVTYNVGELTFMPTGIEMIFHRNADGGLGGLDLWSSTYTGGTWQAPVHLGSTLNDTFHDGWPSLSPDGQELWYTREVSTHGTPGLAIVRSIKNGNTWLAPEEIISGWVGDPAIDAAGNVYFTHVYMDEGLEKIETDIYVITKK